MFPKGDPVGSRRDFREHRNYAEKEISDWNLQNAGKFSKIDENEKLVYGQMVDCGELFEDAKPKFASTNFNRPGIPEVGNRRFRVSQWNLGGEIRRDLKVPQKGESEASETALVDNYPSPHQSIGGRKGRSNSKEDPYWPIFEIREWMRCRNKRNDMCAFPFTILLTVCKRWLAEVDTWIRKLHRNPIRGILARMVELVGNAFKPNDKESADSTFKKLIKRRGDRSLAKGELCAPTTKKRLF